MADFPPAVDVPPTRPLPMGGGLALIGAVTGFLSGAAVAVCIALPGTGSSILFPVSVLVIIPAAFFGTLIGLMGAFGAYLGFRLSRSRRPLLWIVVGSATFYTLVGSVFSLIPGWGQLVVPVAIVELVLGTVALVVFAIARARTSEATAGASGVARM